MPLLSNRVLRMAATLTGIPRASRIIVDGHRRLNYPVQRQPCINTGINKEADSREILFAQGTPSGRFLEIGSGDGNLAYLLGISGNFISDPELYTENKRRFD